MNLVSIQIGLPKTYGDTDSDDPDQKSWTTGIFKHPIEGWAQVHHETIAGDGVADLTCHGGVDKAILAYSADHFESWQSELASIDQVTGGMFGENLTVSGLDETTVCIGDRFQINDVVLEVSQPRQPCWKLARRWGVKTLPKRVVQSGRCGWYLRVITPGQIKAGLPITLLSRTQPDWTIKRSHETMHAKNGDQQIRNQLADLPELAAALASDLRARG